MAPPRTPKLSARPSINLPSDFLSGFPTSRKRTKAKRLTMIAKGKMESKLERIKTLQEKFKKESLKLDNQIKASKQKEMNRTQQSSHGWNPGSSTTPVQQQQQMQQTSWPFDKFRSKSRSLRLILGVILRWDKSTLHLACHKIARGTKIH